MDQIIIVIPYQKWNRYKYMGVGRMCYLEEALHNTGYKNIKVFGEGLTYINGNYYSPLEEFNSDIVRMAFGRGESITVTLKKQ